MSETVEHAVSTKPPRAFENVPPRSGVVGTVLHVGVGVLEESIESGFGVAQGIRSEIHAGMSGTIGWAEGVQKNVFSAARLVNREVDRIAGSMLSGSEKAALAVCGALRKTSRSASDLSRDVGTAVFGERDARDGNGAG